MSGVAGLYRFDGEAVGDEVAAMTAAIDHRGPDGEWTRRAGRVGLGHQRFETTPQAVHAGSPPERDGRVLTFDGRIDNREALLAALDLEGPASEVPDAELVLAAHERWGDDCPERLVGAFAFAIWDPDAGRLFVARDHAGLRPLYYYRGEEFFAFASEVKSLWELEGVPRELDEIRLSNHLCGRLESDSRTFYGAIRRLPPGHVLTAAAGGIDISEYWSLDPERTVNLGSDEAYAERFRELFTEAVRSRLRAKGPVGASLSGGLDSSAVVCVADTLRNDGEMYTYSAVFDRDELPVSDEREYIAPVLERCSVTPRFIRGDRRDPLGDVETVLYHSEQPVLGNNFYISWNLWQEASDDGVRVFLTGNGGDHVVGHGWGYFAQLAARGRWLRLAREIRAVKARDDGGPSLRRLLGEQILGRLLPTPARRLLVRLRNDEFRDATRNPAVDPDFVARTDAEARLIDAVAEKPSRVRRAHHDDLRDDILVTMLERLEKTALAVDVEPRYPFLDRRLMEFCLAVPAGQKNRHGLTRPVLRNAMAGILPPEVRRREGKGNLGPSFWTALREYAADDIEAVLFADRPLVEEFVDLERARAAHREFLDRGATDLMPVWYPVVLELWLRSEVGPGYDNRTT